MSLIAARRFEDQIRIFSDTKKTSPEELLKGVENSLLKTVILGSDLCVGFAGRIGPALIAIEKLDGIIRNRSFDLEQALQYMLSVHIDNDTDFIVATLRPSRLSRIRDHIIESDLDLCWIGDQDAFSTYQEFFSQMPVLDRDDVPKQLAETLNTILRMHMAFIKLVESGKHNNVGEFMIEVGTKPGEGFYYEGAHIGHVGSQALFQLIEDPQKIREWAAAQGSYTYSILAPARSGIGAIGIHFYEGNFGALFYPVKSSTPFLFQNVNEDEFKKVVLNEFGLHLGGLSTQ